MLIDGTDPFAIAKPDARLIKLLIRARRFNATLARQRRRALCRTGQAGRRQPVLFHAARPPQLSRPGHHPSHPRRAAAARSDGREAARALTSAACLARSADRCSALLEKLTTAAELGPGRGPPLPDDISGTAVLEYRPTEISAPVGAISTTPARLCRPRQRRAHPRGTAGFSTFNGRVRARDGLSAGGRWIRTIGPRKKNYRFP